jgi:hypothetical protein
MWAPLDEPRAPNNEIDGLQEARTGPRLEMKRGQQVPSFEMSPANDGARGL